MFIVAECPIKIPLLVNQDDHPLGRSSVTILPPVPIRVVHHSIKCSACVDFYCDRGGGDLKRNSRAGLGNCFKGCVRRVSADTQYELIVLEIPF